MQSDLRNLVEVNMRFTTANAETRKQELKKVLEWQLSGDHHDKFGMARRRVKSNVEFGCITESDAEHFYAMINKTERDAEG